jgi:putative tricarboxylic transport membrane protein
MSGYNDLSRRGFVKAAGALAGAGALGGLAARPAFAAGFPDQNINVYVPTREGGGADRNLRAFTGVWKKYLETNFEPAFYPGAAGRVGYETYMGKAEADCYNLIFGNMGPEVLNYVVKPPSFPQDSYHYFLQVDADPACVFVSKKSKLQTIDDIVAEGKKRTLNVATSRLAHPASLGALVLAQKTGAKFNLVPLSGGRNTRTGVSTGEVDFGVLPASSVVSAADLKVVMLFTDKNPLPDRMPDAVLSNDHFKLGLPPLVAGARAFGIMNAAADKYPDRYQKLIETADKVFGDPDYKAAVIATKAPWEFFGRGDAEACKKYVAWITELGNEYKALLTGAS